MEEFERGESKRRMPEEPAHHHAKAQSLTEASRVIKAGCSVGEVLQAVTEKAREIVGAHQSVTSIIVDGNWARAINAVSLSDKYAAWRNYEEQPDGSGIYRLVCQMNRPLRMTQAEIPCLARVREGCRQASADARMACRPSYRAAWSERRPHPVVG